MNPKLAIDAKIGWGQAKKTFQLAESFLQAVRSRGFAATLGAATGIAPNLGNRVSKEVFEQRVQSCFGGNGQPSCDMLRGNKQGQHFCGACGCRENRLALLDDDKGQHPYEGQYVKLHFPQLQCPLNRGGFTHL